MEQLRREKDRREEELLMRNSELQHECARIKAELDAIIRALNQVLAMKASLEIEIAAYRKLLESEENRSVSTKHIPDLNLPYLIRSDLKLSVLTLHDLS